MNKSIKKNDSGYSLVELAIVMVIIGLLVSGALAGRELLKSAQIKAAISEIETYKIAVDSFLVQYEGLPGDLKNAASFWTGGVTANGNGNGRIGTNVVTDDTEPYYAWDQLSLGRYISGAYSGAGTNGDIGVNSPASDAINGAGFGIWYAEMDDWGCCPSENFTNTAGQFVKANFLVLGAEHSTDNVPLNSGLTPLQASTIDLKLDDGVYNTGKVVGIDGKDSTTTCAYDGIDDENNCVLFVNIDIN